MVNLYLNQFPPRGMILHFRPSDQQGQKTRCGNKPESLRITVRNSTVIYYSNPFFIVCSRCDYISVQTAIRGCNCSIFFVSAQ